VRPSADTVLQPFDSNHSAKQSWEALSELAELVEPDSRTRSEFLEECKSGKFEGVLVAYRTFNSFDITGRFDEELVPLLPESLKFVCHNGTFDRYCNSTLPFPRDELDRLQVPAMIR
jgi:hypothetical protein